MEGMTTLVKLRGGIEQLRSNRHVNRIIDWTDILHAATHDSHPQFDITGYNAQKDMQRLTGIVKQHTNSELMPPAFVPASLGKMFCDLQILAIAKPLLMQDCISNLQGLRPLFGNVLSVVEHRILWMENSGCCSDLDSYKDIDVGLVKTAMLIFTFHGLRDMAISAAFFSSFARRLRHYFLKSFVNIGFALDGGLAAPFLLWICFNGWKATLAQTQQENREFYVKNAADICEIQGISSAEDFCSLMCRIIFLPDFYLAASTRFWADIKALAASP